MFRWVNLTDLHAGMSDQDWLWPNLKHELNDDLKRLIDKSGPVDLILFSGDLVQKGGPAEFSRLSEILGEVFEQLAQFGPSPKLVTAPGNHDLVRPKTGGMLEAALRQVPDDRDLLKAVLDPSREYLAEINTLFAPYLNWRSEMIAANIHLAPEAQGLLAGDASYSVILGEKSVGIVTLNSAWLQLGPGDYEGKLHVDARQLLSVTDNDPVAWSRNNWARLMVTHHPVSWLSPNSISSWNNEIFPPDRFDLHLFGHMHVHSSSATTKGGGGTRRSIQGSSIFGLEQTADGLERSHGYSVCEIAAIDADRKLRVWPRTLKDIEGGGRRLYPDLFQGLDEDNSYSWALSSVGASNPVTTETVGTKINDKSQVQPEVVSIIPSSDADKLRHYVDSAQAHLAIRRAEREAARLALETRSALWITYEWGAGEEGFLWSILSELGLTESPIFRIEADEYKNRSSFLSSFHFSNNFAFEQLCDYLSHLKSSILLIDGIHTPIGQLNQKPIEADIEEICAIVREFSPSTKIVLRGRVRTESVSLPLITLNPLEEADVADYVRAHKDGGDRTPTADIAVMWRHTGGSTVRLDSLLKDLKVTSLPDLIGNELEYGAGLGNSDVPPALVATVRELQNSELDTLNRSYSMLEALSSLPHGERFERMKRFLGAHGFWPKHVHELADRGLVESVLLAGMAQTGNKTPQYALSVPRIVRDFIRDNMPEDRRREIDNRALELYFGRDWGSGEIANSWAGKQCANPLCEPYEIANACTLIQRLMFNAFEVQDTNTIESGFRLASAFVERLSAGHHHSSAADLCSQILPLVDGSEFERQADVLRFGYAKSIRMLGEAEETTKILESIDPAHLSADQKRSVSLNLALAYDGLDDKMNADKRAKEVLKGGRKDGIGLQAQSIIVQYRDNNKQIVADLKKLEIQARKIKAHTAANGMALDLARREPGEASNAHIERVIENSDLKQDFFNGAKAIVKAVENRISVGDSPTESQLEKLIDAYQHLYNERAGLLFDKSHDALWSTFVKSRDIANLLRLFRHSSFIWRLRGQYTTESDYRRTLAKFDAEGAFGKIRGLDREITYLRSRTVAALDEGKGVSAAYFLQQGLN